ncbi:MAG TPA: amino acid ABC transporter permease [Vitreimonas sp.]|nr:amino acid ABC transporter permease [Vitreimonas sp.]
MEPIVNNFGFLLDGFATTLRLSAGAMTLALAIGVVVASVRVWGGPIGSAAGGAYVEFFRNTPLLVQLFFYAVLFAPANLGLSRDPVVVALVGLSVYTGAYVTEVIRSGILSVDQRQTEAARSLGLSQVQTLRRVVLPQAVRTVIPPLGNLSIALVKNTAVASAIGAAELLQVGSIISSRTFRLEPLVGVVVGYLVITIPLAILVGHLERRLRFAR